MAGGVFSSAKLNGVTLRESADDGSDFTNPDADYRRLFLGEDGQLHVKDSAGTVTDIGGSVADILDLATAETDDTLVLAPDGAGGVEFRAETGSSAVVPWALLPPWGVARTSDENFGGTNRSWYVPVVVPAACTITGIRLRITTSSGNYDVGMYSADGATKHASSGSTASPGTGIRDLLFASPYAAAAGRYWLAVAFSSATMAIAASQNTGGIGLSRFEAAYPLPTTATVGSGASTLYPAIAGIISGVTP